MPDVVILVDTDTETLRHTEEILTRAGYLVVTASSYDGATARLESVTPDLLIAAIRLDAFNGLHLAIRTRLDRPHVPVIVTHEQRDVILEAEAKRIGVDFLISPPDDPEFLRRVDAALHHRPGHEAQVRRWSRKQVGGALQVNIADTRARIIDMSYGGIRLAFGNEADIPTRFEIILPSSATPVQAHRVWTAHAPDDEFWCGAELDEGAAHWREFVNSVEQHP
jgi:DNA-binding response OmpR family regulator